MRCDIPSTSGSSLDTITIAAPLFEQLQHQQIVDFCFRADVDAASRFVEQKNVRIAR